MVTSHQQAPCHAYLSLTSDASCCIPTSLYRVSALTQLHENLGLGAVASVKLLYFPLHRKAMSRVRLSDQLRQLTSKRNELKHMAHREARSHMCLLLRHALLLSWCDSMSVLLLGTTANQGPFEENQHLASLIQNEVDLLQQLGSKGTPSDWPTTVAGLVSCQPESFETETISPVAEPMQYLHRTMQQTPLEHAADMTAEGVAGFMRSTVISSSIQLHQMRGRPPWEQPSLLQSVASGWDRCAIWRRSEYQQGTVGTTVDGGPVGEAADGCVLMCVTVRVSGCCQA